VRRQLALVAAAITSMLALAFLVPLGLLISTQAEDRALAQAQREAEAAAAVLAVAASFQQSAATPSLADAVVASLDETGDLSVVLADGYVAGREDIDPETLARARAGTAFTASRTGGAEVLVPVGLAGARVPAVVRVVTDTRDFRRGVTAAWVVLALLGAVLVAAAVAVADRISRSVTKPMSALAAAAERLGAGDLDQRVAPDGPPELLEMGEAFNTLASQLRLLLEAERESVADLSHRLRTPLAALRLGVETLPVSGDRDGLLADVDSLESAVDELIMEARRGAAAEEQRCDAAAVARDRARFWEVLADDQGRRFDLQTGAGPHEVGLSGRDLGAVIDTLIENVFTHTDPGVVFSLTVRREDAWVAVEVADEGPGFHSQLASRGLSKAGSTGLGLDIATRTVERADGTVIVGDPPGGSVTLLMPSL